MPEKKITYKSLKELPDTAWEALSKRKIYFGHQSVGYNILDGIKDLQKDYPQLKLKIVETTNPVDFSNGILAHSKVGENFKPISKIIDFVKNIDQGIGKTADAVGLKLCYVDLIKETDAVSVFTEYEDNIERIRQKYPDLTIVHFTMPLQTLQTGFKEWIKSIIGRPRGGSEHNIRRNEYNELLREKYLEKKDPILDIAAIESTYPDGTRCSFKANGKIYYALVPEYTYDGGHLNESGRNIVAEQLVLLLANID